MDENNESGTEEWVRPSADPAQGKDASPDGDWEDPFFADESRETAGPGPAATLPGGPLPPPPPPPAPPRPAPPDDLFAEMPAEQPAAPPQPQADRGQASAPQPPQPQFGKEPAAPGALAPATPVVDDPNIQPMAPQSPFPPAQRPAAPQGAPMRPAATTPLGAQEPPAAPAAPPSGGTAPAAPPPAAAAPAAPPPAAAAPAAPPPPPPAPAPPLPPPAPPVVPGIPSEAGHGLQGPEFVAKRGVPILEGAEPETEPSHEEVHAAESFAGKPTSVAGRSPITLSSKRTRIGLAVVAGAALIFLATRFLGGDEKGVALALNPPPVEGTTYRVQMGLTGTAGINGGGGRDYEVDAEGLTTLAQGPSGEWSVTVSNPALVVTPEPRHPIVVPPLVHGGMTVAPDGSVRGGSFGFAEAIAAGPALPPGWDFALPPLPEGEVEVGESWRKSVSVPYGSGFISYESKARLLGVEDGVAVVEATFTVPLNVTVKAADLAGGQTQIPPSYELAPGAELELQFSGEADLTGSYWVETATGRIQKVFVSGDVNLTRVTTGLSEEMGGQQTIEVSGKMNFWIREVPRPAEKSSTAESPAVGVGERP